MTDLDIGCTVHTPYGDGDLLSTNDEQITIRLSWGAVAHLDARSVMKKKKLFEMTDSDKLSQALKHKSEGNMFFKMNDWDKALERYQISLVYLKHMQGRDANETLKLHNNQALVFSKAGRFAQAVAECDEALKLLHDNRGGQTEQADLVKCLYLRAQAQRNRGDLEDAAKDLYRAAKEAPQNKLVRDELNAVKKDLNKAKEQQAAVFSGVFNKTNKFEDKHFVIDKVERVADNTGVAVNTAVAVNTEVAAVESTALGKTKIVRQDFFVQYGTHMVLGLSCVSMIGAFFWTSGLLQRSK